MQSSIEIAIIIDTNIFTPSKNKTINFSKLPLEKYYKILRTLELNDLHYEINILFPEIVLLELIAHHIKNMSNKLEYLKKINKEFQNFEEIKIEGYDNINIESFQQDLENKYLKELNIINIPSDKVGLFETILEMSIKKKAPFIEGKSDKGFKDSILFLSLLKFAETNLYDKYILFTDDKGFSENKKKLQIQFRNHINNFRKFNNCNELEIIKDKNIMKYIDEEFELFKDLKEYLSKEFFDKLYSEYEKAMNIKIDFNEYNIDECELIEDDTTIHQMDINEFEVEFYIYVHVLCYDNYMNSYYWNYSDNNRKSIIQSESYIFRKENNEWDYYLNSRVYEIEFD